MSVDLAGPFAYEFMRRAAVVAVLVGATCPLLGVYVVLRRLALLGDGIAHASFAGIVAAYVRGIDYRAGALLVAIVTALGVTELRRRTRLSSDTAIGVLFTGFFALGVFLLSRARSVNVNLEDLLFGNVLGVTAGDVAVDAALSALVLLAIVTFYRPLLYASFDPQVARASGIRVGAIDAGLLVLLALVIVVSISSVGVVLVAALLVTPAATALQFARTFHAALLASSAIGIASAFGGLYLSYYLGAASGATIVLLATAIFLAVAVTTRTRV